MKRALFLIALSYLALLAIFLIGSKTLWIFRTRVWGGITVGDIAMAMLILSYGLFIYILAILLTRDSCKSGHRDV